MSPIKPIFIAIAAAALFGCQASSDAQSEDLTQAAGHQVDGFQETVLAVGEAAPGMVAVFEVGEQYSRKELTVEVEGYPVAAHSRHNRFYLLYSNGQLLVVDAEANLVAGHQLAEGVPGDLAIVSETEALATFEGSPTVYSVDLATGATAAAFEVGYETEQPLRCETMTIVDGRLFVAIAEGDRYEPKGGALAVVELASGEVIKHIDLTYSDPDTGERYVPLNPDLPLVLDAPRNVLFVTASGNRPIDPGMAVKVDLDRLEVIELVSHGGAFHGHRVLSQPHHKMLEIRHTSTPVASTHISELLLNADGSVTPVDGPTILDLFEETENLTLNEDGSLAMIPNSCPVGFCIGGKGINFIDVATATLLPKLTAEEAGIVPSHAVFLRQ